MERRQAPRRGAGGGEGIPAARADRARLAAGATSVAIAAGTGAWLAAIAEDAYLVRATLVGTALAALLLAGALALRRPVAIPFAVCLLAAPYVARLGFEVDALDTRAPLIAGLLFAITELAYWSLELRGALADEPGTYLRKIALLAGLVVGTIAAGTGVLALVATVSARGTSVDVLGALGAATAIGLLALAAARRTGS